MNQDIQEKELTTIKKDNKVIAKYCNKCGYKMAKGIQSSLFGNVKIYICPNCGNIEMEAVTP